MADLESLIKYRNHELDDKKKILGDIFKEFEQVELQKKVLLDKLESERVLAYSDDNLETNTYFGKYAEAVLKKVELLDIAMVKLEIRISIAQESVRAAFAELKKVEITNDRRKEEEKAEIEKKISNEMDEIGIESFRRGQD